MSLTMADETVGQAPGIPNTPSVSSASHATVKNPVYGLLEGAKRGNNKVGQ